MKSTIILFIPIFASFNIGTIIIGQGWQTLYPGIQPSHEEINAQ